MKASCRVLATTALLVFTSPSLIWSSAEAAIIELDGSIFNQNLGGARFSLLHNGNSGSSGPELYVLPNQAFSYSIDNGANGVFGDTGDRIFYSGSQTIDLAASGSNPNNPGAPVAKMIVTDLDVTIQSTTFTAKSGLTDAYGNEIGGEQLHRIMDNSSMSFEIRTADSNMSLLFSGMFDLDNIVSSAIFNGSIMDTRLSPAVSSTFLWGSTDGSLNNPGGLLVKDIVGGSDNRLITNMGVDIGFGGAVPVPEPLTLSLFVFGLAGLGFAMRKNARLESCA